MGLRRSPAKVKLIVGLISNDTRLFSRVRVLLERAFRNRLDFESAPVDFSHTDYYGEEFGENLKRVFLSFEKPVALKSLFRAKVKTNALETRFLKPNGKRTINIDPGYLDLSKLVLFSTKDYSHRVYLGEGIYAEVTLYFKDKTFNPWPWTYPDYRSENYIAIFNRIRELYKSEVA